MLAGVTALAAVVLPAGAGGVRLFGSDVADRRALRTDAGGRFRTFGHRRTIGKGDTAARHLRAEGADQAYGRQRTRHPVTRRGRHAWVGAPGRNRTYDTRFRKPMLYPLSYEGLRPISYLPGRSQECPGVPSDAHQCYLVAW